MAPVGAPKPTPPEALKQFGEGIKWFAGMSAILVAASPSVFEKLTPFFRWCLFAAVLFEVISMVAAGVALIMLSEKHKHEVQGNSGDASASATAMHRALLRHIVFLLLGFGAAIVSFVGLALNPQAEPKPAIVVQAQLVPPPILAKRDASRTKAKGLVPGTKPLPGTKPRVAKPHRRRSHRWCLPEPALQWPGDPSDRTSRFWGRVPYEGLT